VKHYRWICLLLLAMATTQTLAQEEPGAAETPPAQTEAGSGEVAATPEPDPAVDQAATGNETSPFDYRASEEISEDLSVSFPVDI
jgi:hypothetical protein